MLRERVELEEAQEREQAAREARRRHEQERAQSNSGSFVDAQIEKYLSEISYQAIAEFTSEYVSKRTKKLRDEFADEVRDLKSQIAELERRLDARASQAARNFRFARDRSSAGEKPVRNVVTKVH